MPDITKCTNEKCQLSHSCYRFNCDPSEYSQSYDRFEPNVDEILDEVDCLMYLNKPNIIKLN